jgi:uncharacterized damage-inducible protein DinB
MNRYSFLTETYATERLKTLSVWAMFRDEDMQWRPEPRARSVHEQMVHQCVSENNWMKNFFGIEVTAPLLPAAETRRQFLRTYAAASGERLEKLRLKPESWFEEETVFFDVNRSRTWIFVRRIAHSAHHRGQLTAYLRSLARDVYSTYGPTADTNDAVRYMYPDLESLLLGEAGEAKNNP